MAARPGFLYRNLAAGLTPTGPSSSTAAGLGWDKLNDPQPRHRARVSGTSAILAFDLGSAQSVDCWALISTNLGSAARARVRGSTVDGSAPSNRLLHSHNFTNAAWGKNNVTIDSATETDPNSGTTASTVDEDASTGAHFIDQTISGLPDDITVRVSCYIKQKIRTWARLAWTDKSITEHYTNVNLATGALGLSGGSPGNITVSLEAQGFYRVSFTASVSSGGGTPRIDVHAMTGDNASAVYLGVPGNDIIVFGAMLDYDTRTNTYLPTTTAAIAPAVDTGFTTQITANDSYNGNVVAAFASTAARYWRIDIDGATNPIDIGLAPLGLLFRPAIGFDYGAQEGRLDLSIRDMNQDTGAEFGLAGPKKRMKLLTFGALSETEVRGFTSSVDDMDRYVGASGDVLFVSDSDASWINRSRDSIWGSFREIGASLAARAHPDYWTRSFRLVERL